jgi:hypothetical protein
MLRAVQPIARKLAIDLGEAEETTVLIAQRIDDDVRPEARAVLAQAPRFGFEFPRRPGDFEVPAGLVVEPLLDRIEARVMMADDFVGCIALGLLRARVSGRDDAIDIEHVDGVAGDALHEPAVHQIGRMIQARRHQALSAGESGEGGPVFVVAH